MSKIACELLWINLQADSPGNVRALTALADVENMRVRMNIKADEDRKFAVRALSLFSVQITPLTLSTQVRGFAKNMLEVADCLEKALEVTPSGLRYMIFLPIAEALSGYLCGLKPPANHFDVQRRGGFDRSPSPPITEHAGG